MFSFLFAFFIVGLGLACVGHVSFAQDFSGPYHIDSPSGPLQMTLQQEADRVAGTFVGFDGTTYQVQGAVVVDAEDGAGAVEGTLTSAQDNVLYVSYAGSPWTPFAQVEVAGDRLLLTYPQDGSRQLWYRQ